MKTAIIDLVKGMFVLALALSVPVILLSPPEQLDGVISKIKSKLERKDSADAAVSTGAVYTTNYTPPSDNADQKPTTTGIAEAFRFDVSPQKITQTWPDTATRISQGNYLGYRVPLVTGPEPYDLVGIMTYYYDRNMVLQMITFKGRTDDYQQLATLLQRGYSFVPRPSNTQFVMMFEKANERGDSRSNLWVQPTIGSVEMQTYRQYEVAVTLDRSEYMRR